MQVLAEQCRRLGLDVEASSAQTAALALAGNGNPVGKKKPAWNLDISAIHRRIKDEVRAGGGHLGAGAPASQSSEQSPLPPGWEVSHFIRDLGLACSMLLPTWPICREFLVILGLELAGNAIKA
jgi:hypothetical protein